MEYRTVFDAANVGFNWTPVAFGLAFVVVGCGFIVARNIAAPALRTIGRAGHVGRAFPYVFLAFALVWTTLATYWTYSAYSETQAAVAAGHFKVVSGLV